MPESDRDLVKLVTRGDLKSFGVLVDRHKGRAMTLAVRMLKNRQEAEEAVQDAFVRAYHSLSAFEGRSSFSTWFYRIVYNVCSTALRKRRLDEHSSIEARAESGLPEPEAQDALPDALVESNELGTFITKAMEALPPIYAAVVSLFFLQERSYEEIVEITGLPLATVKIRLFRARTMLRGEILKQLGTTASSPGPITTKSAAIQGTAR